MPRRKKKKKSHSGTAFEDLVILSVVAIGVVVVAYIYMSDFQRAVHVVVSELLTTP